jgi:hypothetical protein
MAMIHGFLFYGAFVLSGSGAGAKKVGHYFS